MKKLLLFILSGMFLASYAFGQENYQKGYVITSKSDTVQGFVNYRNWGINPGQISFKKTLNGKKVMYNPMNIRSFYVHNETYVSAIVKSETSSRNIINFMSDSAGIITRTDTTFLMVLARGSKSLFFFKNDLNIENFYVLQDGKPELLEYKKYIAANKGSDLNVQNYLKENRKYVGQLLLYMRDCQKLRSQISSTAYTRESLNRLFQNYYKCKHENITQIAKVEKAKLKFGILAGISNSNVSFSGDGVPYATNASFNTSMNFTGGIIVDLIMPRNLHEWSVHNEITYISFEPTGQSGQYKVGFGYSAIAINDMARFNYSFGKFSAFVDAGVSNGIILKYTNYIVTTSKTNLFPTDGLAKRDFSWIGGIGVGYKKLTFEMRLDFRSGVSKLFYEGEGCKRYSFLIGYTL